MSTRDFIHEAINTHKVCIFSDTTCTFVIYFLNLNPNIKIIERNCTKIKKYLTENGVSFTPIEINQRSNFIIIYYVI